MTRVDTQPVTRAEVDAAMVCTRCGHALVLGQRYATVPTNSVGSVAEIWCSPCVTRNGQAVRA